MPRTASTSAKKPTRSAAQHDPRRAAIYVRISLDATGEALGVQRQEKDARDICAQRDWNVIGVYRDNSISASDRKAVRPGYDAMRRDYDAGLFDALVCYDLDRLTRQPRQLEDWIDAAEGRGLALVTTNGEADLTTDGGRMYARIKAAVARAEIERKSARHKAALKQRASLGRVPFGPAPLGYDTKGKVVAAEAKIVRRIFASFDAGESLRGIARALTTDGVPTRKGGAVWSTRTVRDVLCNPRYAGWAIHQRAIAVDDSGNRVRGDWKPLVSVEMFDVAQARLSDPSRKTNREGTHRRCLGSSLYVCDVCDATVRATDRRYACPRGHLIRVREHVDQFVIGVIAGWLGRPGLRERLAPPAEDTASVVAEAERLRNQMTLTDADYDNDLIDARRWRAKKQKLEAQLAEVDKVLASHTGASALDAIAAAPDPAEAFLRSTLMRQRAIIDAICTVRLRKTRRGRLPGGEVIAPDSVFFDWR